MARTPESARKVAHELSSVIDLVQTRNHLSNDELFAAICASLYGLAQRCGYTDQQRATLVLQNFIALERHETAPVVKSIPLIRS